MKEREKTLSGEPAHDNALDRNFVRDVLDCWQKGATIMGEADHVAVCLNQPYVELRAAYREPLPEPGNMEDFLHLILNTAKGN